MKKTEVELLAPAKDISLGIAAINHGAGAVYIGAERFGARAAASNPIEDIERLAKYAHLYNARVYLALNTILYEEELEAARKLIYQAWNVGVDALIVQDMALLEMDLPNIPLHASTQMHNLDLEHIRFLEAAGFSRVILARELALKSIENIRKNTGIELEAFVHGALCVSYSGRCYASLALGSRSANRGLCAQPCRLLWELYNEKNSKFPKDKHFLSIRDMDRSNKLSAMLRAGITSFKIEGRLKDISYLKNITAFYRQRLDALLEDKGPYKAASYGNLKFFFKPSPEKTFNRSGCDYFLSGKREDIAYMDTPKSLGEPMGRISEVKDGFIFLDKKRDIVAGDGLCFFDKKEKLHGFFANSYDGKKIGFNSRSLSGLNYKDAKNALLYRNSDKDFKKLLDLDKSALRKLPLALEFYEKDDLCFLRLEDKSSGLYLEESIEKYEKAKNPKANKELISRQLSKLGESNFELESIDIKSDLWFFKVAELNALRRKALDKLESLILASYQRPLRKDPVDDFSKLLYPVLNLDSSFNISNSLAKAFYEKHGARVLTMAHEKEGLKKGDLLMITKHCLRFSLKACPVHQGAGNNDKWRLKRDGLSLDLVFDCKACLMKVFLS